MAWFRKIRGSKTNQKWRAAVVLMLFGFKHSKQVELQVPKGEWSKCFCSARLENAQIRHCHGSCLQKTEHGMNFQLVFEVVKSFQLLARWWRNQWMLELFENFRRKMQKCENAKWENESFLCVFRLLLGLNGQKMTLIFAVLSLLMKC